MRPGCVPVPRTPRSGSGQSRDAPTAPSGHIQPEPAHCLWPWLAMLTRNHSEQQLQTVAVGRLISPTLYHRMAWLGRDLKGHLLPALPPWAGTPLARSGSLKPHPSWAWTLAAIEQSQLLWTVCLRLCYISGTQIHFALLPSAGVGLK